MTSLYRIWVLSIVSILLINCKNDKKNKPIPQEKIVEKPSTFITPLGKEFTISEPSAKLLGQYEEAKKVFEANTNDVNP